MPSHFEDLLADSLRDRADAGSPVDPVPVMRSAVTRGQRIRLRRRVAGGLLAAAVIAGASVYGVTTARRAAPVTGPRPGPSASTGAPARNLALLPAAPVAGAITRPDLVGADPRVVHFAVDAMLTHATGATWHVARAYEVVTFNREGYQASVVVARDQASLRAPESLFKLNESTPGSPVVTRAGDQPATLSAGRTRPAPATDGTWESSRIWSLVWQPVPGLWADVQVVGESPDRAQQVAAQIRFDQAQHCALPFRMDAPAGTALQECRLSLIADGGHIFESGALIFRDRSRTLVIQGINNWWGGGNYPRPLKAGSNRVWADPDKKSWTMIVGGVYFDLWSSGRPGTFSVPEVLAAATTVQVVPDIENPAAW